MLIPITHENMEGRRWPWLTTVLVVVNVLCLVALMVATALHQKELRGKATEMDQYWKEHPTARMPAVLRELGAQDTTYRGPGARGGEAATEEEQQGLDRLAEELVGILHDDPSRNWGYVPKEGGFVTLVTYQFLHGGILHLVFNMWFMWLCACNLEDRWGKWLFLGMYLAAGVVAALAHKASAPESNIPLIGASGAVAGAMGAFLVIFARTKIRFFYWYGIRFGTFLAPAWLMLPLWLGQEIASGVLFAGADGTAHFAHVGGFVFGAAFAGVLLPTGIDRRLDAAQEAQVTTGQDERILAAGRLIDEGKAAEAVVALERYLAGAPSSIDASLELLRATLAARDTARMARVYARLVDLYLADGSLRAAADLYAEADQNGAAESIAVATRMRLAAQLKTQDIERAGRIYVSIVRRGIGPGLVAQAHLEQASILVGRGRDGEAGRLLDLIESSGQAPELADAIKSLRSRILRPSALDL